MNDLVAHLRVLHDSGRNALLDIIGSFRRVLSNLPGFDFSVVMIDAN